MEQNTETQTQVNPTTGMKSTHRFEAQVEEVLKLVIHSLYSNKEIFLRELISNASDAIDKHRFLSLTDKTIAAKDAYEIKLEPNVLLGTLTIKDNGIGMSKEELIAHLGTVAKSGTKEFVSKLDAAKRGDVSQIGQFGVGFYAAYLVADRVRVISKRAGTEETWIWESDGTTNFTVESLKEGLGENSGTHITLFLKEEAKEFLQSFKLESMVKTYSDFVMWPILLKKDGEKDSAPERLNQGTALWQKQSKEITEAQATELYKHISHDFESPRFYKHFKVEGNQEFAGMVFIPQRAPFDLFHPEAKHGIRLHVKRVFIMDEAEALLPKWLRFVKGIVDSEDLPLNVSRELLQDSKLVGVIKKQLTRQTLDLLLDMAKDKPEEYLAFYKTFGSVLKEGFHFEPEHKDKLKKLVRYACTDTPGWVSLEDYKTKMKEGQKAIYYALGESREQIERSPVMEGLRAKGYPVLLMSDAVDNWTLGALTEVDGVPLVSASSSNLDLSETEEDKSKRDAALPLLRNLLRVELQTWVSEVKVSSRLADSPLCLVVPEGGLQPYLERMLRGMSQAEGEGMPLSKRLLEINPTHPLMVALEKKLEGDPESADVKSWVTFLYDQALLLEGSPMKDPANYTKKVTELLTHKLA